MNNGDLPASPLTQNEWEDTYLHGLSKREEFAKAAMQGILSNIKYFVLSPDEDIAPITVAKLAKKHAEEALKELDND